VKRGEINTIELASSANFRCVVLISSLRKLQMDSPDSLVSQVAASNYVKYSSLTG
jgi:hypothetical protein